MTTESDVCYGRILVVDDEPYAREILREILGARGYQIEEAGGFEEAQERLGEESFDLVTLDIIMPGTNGLQVLAWIKEHHPDTGVVMASALDDLEMVIEAMAIGAYSYLIKPFKLELVRAEIARAMERQRLVAENRAYQEKLEQTVEARTRELRQANARLRLKVRELDGRDRLVHFQMEESGFDRTYEEILLVLQAALGVQRATVYRTAETGDRLEAVAGLGLSQPGRLEEAGLVAAVPALSLEEQEGLEVRAFRARKLEEEEGELAVPLVYRDEVIGLVRVGEPLVEKGLQEEARHGLWRLAQEATLLVRSVQMMEGMISGRTTVDDLLEME